MQSWRFDRPAAQLLGSHRQDVIVSITASDGNVSTEIWWKTRSPIPVSIHMSTPANCLNELARCSCSYHTSLRRGLRRTRMSFPVLNAGTTFFGTDMSFPVRGFRPVRARRTLTENAPNPRSSTRSPRAIAETTQSRIASTIFSTSRRYKWGYWFAIRSISSDLIHRMTPALSLRMFKESKGHQSSRNTRPVAGLAMTCASRSQRDRRHTVLNEWRRLSREFDLGGDQNERASVGREPRLSMTPTRKVAQGCTATWFTKS